MTSASTKRRNKRKAPPPKTIPGLASEVMAEMMKPPGQEDYDAALRRARSTGSKDAEIRRLRAAMVHAMDDAEWGAKNAGVGAVERARFLGIVHRLKIALEKK